MSVRYLVGDTREQIQQIADGSVSLIATSPPFVALRSYLPADHPLKHAEIGTEPDPGTFIGTLLELVADWGRVLAPWGSIAVELGDTYSGASAEGSDQKGSSRYPNGRGQNDLAATARKHGSGWPQAKSLALVPQAFALSLAYGRNVLTGESSPAGRWLVRNMVVWHRPNPAVGLLGDKYRPSTSYITVATRSSRRWFDLTAVRTTPSVDPSLMPAAGRQHEKAREQMGRSPDATGKGGNPAGAPPLDAWFDEHDVWTVTSQPSRLAHFAMWPPRLAERLILSMCPAEVCATCDQPRARIEQQTSEYSTARAAIRDAQKSPNQWDQNVGNRAHGFDGSAATLLRNLRTHETVGWTDCGHDNYRPGVVLDPFAGTGTTLAVAQCHQRDAIGIDIDERNQQLYPARLAEVQRSLLNIELPDPNQMQLFDPLDRQDRMTT